ncbi:Transcription initiation factor TFIID subunit 13 [Borealophlyctis nickersoniae]|nr:Transcription initiation factor TFIID subunit 13 [Borealophlyctis nickersoniae]
MNRSTRPRKEKKQFSRESQLMYGFGDVTNPAQDTVELMEEMLMIYFADLAAEINKVSTGNKIKLSDILHALRNDPKKLGRAQELIAMSKEIQEAKRLVDRSELPDLPATRGGAIL